MFFKKEHNGIQNDEITIYILDILTFFVQTVTSDYLRKRQESVLNMVLLLSFSVCCLAFTSSHSAGCICYLEDLLLFSVHILLTCR